MLLIFLIDQRFIKTSVLYVEEGFPIIFCYVPQLKINLI